MVEEIESTANVIKGLQIKRKEKRKQEKRGDGGVLGMNEIVYL